MPERDKRDRPPVRLLTVFLAKDGIEEAALIVKKGNIKKTAVEADGKKIGTLYSKGGPPHAPTWTQFFGSAIEPRKLGLLSAGASAALLLPVRSRLLVVTFGYGRHLIDRSLVETSFGLRVTLNAVDDGGIRSIDRTTFEGVTNHIREQTSREGSFSNFGLNVERDLLRAIVGTPKDDTLALRLSGMDALSASSRVTLSKLPDLLTRFVDKSLENTYRSKYPWIDNIAEIRDPTLVDSLNANLIKALRSGDLTKKWLSVPDPIDWAVIDGFRYGKSSRKELHHDIHWTTYLQRFADSKDVSLETLKRHRVFSFSATDGNPIDSWTVYDCIYAELNHKGGTYLLNNGAWYKIDSDFLVSIDNALKTVPEGTLSLPACPTDEHEAAYNKRIAKALGNACVMDAKNIPYGGGHSQIEFCDVLTKSKQMLHVKRYSGSAVLSHLFAQGAVAATALVSDAEFRKRLNTKLPSEYRLANPLVRPQARHWEVAYVVVSQSAKKLELPFFSRVTLRNAIRTLEPLGFKITLTKVITTG